MDIRFPICLSSYFFKMQYLSIFFKLGYIYKTVCRTFSRRLEWQFVLTSVPSSTPGNRRGWGCRWGSVFIWGQGGLLCWLVAASVTPFPAVFVFGYWCIWSIWCGGVLGLVLRNNFFFILVSCYDWLRINNM